MNAQLEQLQARFRGQFDQLQTQVRGQLDQLQPRERVIVIAGSVVLLVVVLYLLIWEPLILAGRHRADELDTSRALAVRIESAASLVQGSGSAAVDRSAPLLSVVDQSSRGSTLGVPPTRVQPEGNGDKAVKVWFENVPFDNAVRWLGELQTRYAIQVTSAEIEPASAPGVVNARFTLSR